MSEFRSHQQHSHARKTNNYLPPYVHEWRVMHIINISLKPSAASVVERGLDCHSLTICWNAISKAFHKFKRKLSERVRVQVTWAQVFMHVLQMLAAHLLCERHHSRCNWDSRCEQRTCLSFRNLSIMEKRCMYVIVMVTVMMMIGTQGTPDER